MQVGGGMNGDRPEAEPVDGRSRQPETSARGWPEAELDLGGEEAAAAAGAGSGGAAGCGEPAAAGAVRRGRRGPVSRRRPAEEP